MAGGVRRARYRETNGTSAKNQYLTYDFHCGLVCRIRAATRSRYKGISRWLTVSCHENRRATAVVAQAQPPPHLGCYSFRNGVLSPPKFPFYPQPLAGDGLDHCLFVDHCHLPRYRYRGRIDDQLMRDAVKPSRWWRKKEGERCLSRNARRNQPRPLDGRRQTERQRRTRRCASAVPSRLTSVAFATAAMTSCRRSRAVPSRALTTYWCRRGRRCAGASRCIF